jgi:mRNA interferase RelE/StbE
LSYRIELKKSAAKSLRKIPKADQKRIAGKIDSLAENPPNPDTTKIRVGDYRIVYEIHEDVLLILIVKIGHRKDIYKNIS